MNLKVDYRTLEKNIRKFNGEEDLLSYMKELVDFLYYHNKNYNQTQWIVIQDLQEIIKNMNVKGGENNE